MMLELTFPAESTVQSAANCFLFRGDEILLKEQAGKYIIPTREDIEALEGTLELMQYIGALSETPCYTGSFKTVAPSGYALQKLRPLYSVLAEDSFGMALRAYHLLTWLKSNQYCGCCGTKMQTTTEELTQKCPNCSHVAYPKISPAIIVAITKEDKILLAHSTRFPAGRYSVIAGFVEAGETLEDCVRREAQEEVGIEVKDISYFDSQPWPFPDSLMIGFTAKWAGNEIKVDEKEIAHADWFTADSLPNTPALDSLGGRLIAWFCSQQNKQLR